MFAAGGQRSCLRRPTRFAHEVSLVAAAARMKRASGRAVHPARKSSRPFLGVVLLAETVTWTLAVAGGLMTLGLFLHLTERHGHEHVHEPIEHAHGHVHDDHHRHEMPPAWRRTRGTRTGTATSRWCTGTLTISTCTTGIDTFDRSVRHRLDLRLRP